MFGGTPFGSAPFGSLGEEPSGGTFTLSGGDVLSETGLKGGKGSASLSGGDVLSEVGEKSASGTLAVSGGGDLSATATHTGSLTLSGGGAAAATIRKGARGGGRSTGGGTLSASNVRGGAVSISTGDSALAVTATRTVIAAAISSGGGIVPAASAEPPTSGGGAYGFTAWESYTYDIALADILAAQASGVIPANAFLDVATVQLQAVTRVSVDADAEHDEISDTDQVLQRYGSGETSVTHPLAGATGMYAHSIHGDGVAITNWWDIPAAPAARWVGFPGDTSVYDVQTPVEVGSPYHLIWDSPTYTVNDAGDKVFSITWTIAGDVSAYAFIDSPLRILAGSYNRGAPKPTETGNVPLVNDDAPGYDSGDVDGLEYRHTFTVGPGEYYAINVAIGGGGVRSYTNGFFAASEGLTDTDTDALPGVPATLPALTSATLTTGTGRGYTSPATWNYPGNPVVHEGNTIMAGTTVTADTHTIVTYTPTGSGSPTTYDRSDTCHASAYQGVFGFKTPSGDWSSALPTSMAPSPDASGSSYGAGSIYEYSWTSQSLTPRLDAAYPSSGSRPFSGAYLYGRTISWDTPETLAGHWWQPSELPTSSMDIKTQVFASSSTYELELAATALDSGVAIQVTNQDFHTSPSYQPTTGTETGEKFFAVISGTVRLTGQRRIKYPVLVMADAGHSGRAAFESI